MKHYISEVIGTGTDEDTRIPATTGTVVKGWAATDGREDNHTSDGFMKVVIYNPTPAEHAALLADSRVEYIGET